MAKKQTKNKVPGKRYAKYKVEGNKIASRGMTCPKCGPGIFLAEHKDRQTCGTCSYTVMKSKEQPKPEEKKAEVSKPKEEKK